MNHVDILMISPHCVSRARFAIKMNFLLILRIYVTVNGTLLKYIYIVVWQLLLCYEFPLKARNMVGGRR